MIRDHKPEVFHLGAAIDEEYPIVLHVLDAFQVSPEKVTRNGAWDHT